MFARVDDLRRGGAGSRRLADQVTDARPWGDERPETTLNAALTASGLAAVGVPEDVLATFPEEFRQGMAARAELLGDAGPSAPDQWEQPLGTGEAHVFLTLHAENDEALVGRITSIRDELGELGGIEIVYEQHAVHPLEGRDHFGFLDGVSQPVIDGGGVEPRPGDGVFGKRGNWRAMKPGDFILGYVDEDGVIPEAPGPARRQRHVHDLPQARDGRGALPPDDPRGRTALPARGRGAARGEGRRPLARRHAARRLPARARPGRRLRSARINDFRYEDDPTGSSCPSARTSAAPTRGTRSASRARPSVGTGSSAAGRPYGPPLPEGVLEDDGVDRGLVFTCFNASIARQFELIQRIWVEDGDAFGLADDKDFLIADGRGSNKMTIQGSPPFFLSPQPGFVTTRGGEYLFRPGLRALRALGAGPSALR